MATVVEPIRRTHFARYRPPQWLARLVSPEMGVFAVLWLALLAGGRSRLFQDPGTFWHTAVGRQILDSGEFVARDTFTFTHEGSPWVAHQWLGECGLAALEAAGGWDLLLLFTATLLAGLYAWLAGRLRQCGLHWFAAALVVVVAVGAGSHHFHVRPHLATLVFTAVSFAWLCDVEAGRMNLRRLWWLLPLFVLWTNLHGGMLGGLATLGLAFAGWTLARWRGWASPLASLRQAWLLGGVWLAAAATMMINPYGVDLPRTWLAIMQMSLPEMIEEHRRLDWLHPEGWMVLLLAAAWLVTLVSTIRWRSPALGLRITWLIPLVWLVLACDRVRHAPLFAVVAILALAEMLPHSRLIPWLEPGEWFSTKGIRKTDRRLAGLGLLATCVTALLLSVALQQAGNSTPVVGAGWARLDKRHWPVELLPELKAIEPHTAAEARLFNTLDFGGFVTFHAPQLRTFIDDRCELFGDSFLRQYSEAENGRPEQLDRWREQYQFQHALVRSGSAFDRHLTSHAGWRLVRRSTAAALYRYKYDVENQSDIEASRP